MSNPSQFGPNTYTTAAGRIQLVIPAQVNVADPAGLTDLNLVLLSLDVAGRLRVLATLAAGQTVNVSPAVLANSPGALGVVTSAAAGGAIATIAAGSLPAGTYDVQVFVLIVSGGGAGDNNNMEFRRGATVVSSLMVINLGATMTSYPPVKVFRAVLDGATAVSVNATAAATVGSVYAAQLIATRVA